MLPVILKINFITAKNLTHKMSSVEYILERKFSKKIQTINKQVNY